MPRNTNRPRLPLGWWIVPSFALAFLLNWWLLNQLVRLVAWLFS